MAQAEVIEILKKYLKILRSEGIQIERAFLYGSYLTGTATDESDIDLMLVTDKANDDNLAGTIWYLTGKVSTKIEPFLVSPKHFYSDDNSPLVDLVRRTGLEIA